MPSSLCHYLPIVPWGTAPLPQSPSWWFECVIRWSAPFDFICFCDPVCLTCTTSEVTVTVCQTDGITYVTYQRPLALKGLIICLEMEPTFLKVLLCLCVVYGCWSGEDSQSVQTPACTSTALSVYRLWQHKRYLFFCSAFN